MRILIKPGVVFQEINDRFLHVAQTAFVVWQRWGLTPTVTCAYEPRPGTTSLHPKHSAWDLRVRGLPDPIITAEILRSMLNIGAKDYDVVYGDAKHLDHIHVEYDPKHGGE